MKNTMKKIMSLVLVAMLLVSAIPMGASAFSIGDASAMQDPNSAYNNPTEAPTQPAVAPTQAPTEAPTQPAAPAPTEAPKARAGSRTLIATDAPVVVTGIYDMSNNNAALLTESVNVNLVNQESATAAELLEFCLGENAKMYTVGAYYDMNATGTPAITRAIVAGDRIQINVTKNSPIIVKTKIDNAGSYSTNELYYAQASVDTMLTDIYGADWASRYEIIANENGNAWASSTTKVAGETIKIVLKSRTTTATEAPTQATEAPTQAPDTQTPTEAPATTAPYYNKFPYNVYLNIYKDTMVGAPDKTVNITNGIAIDGTVHMDEVKSLVMEYYSAKNSYGIKFDGLYLAEGTWVTNYVTDTRKYESFVDVNNYRMIRTVYINVMIDNATAKYTNTGVASDNPKTGDSIYGAMTVLGLSATALATAMYVYNKKRAAV